MKAITLLFSLIFACSGCSVVSVAGSAVATTVSVAGTVVSTTASVAGSAVKGVAHAVAGGSDDKNKN